jgi:type I restriction enzyme R subunit
VKITRETVSYGDADGKLVTESIRDFSRNKVRGEYSTLSQFLSQWTHAEKKTALLSALEAQGLPLAELQDAVGRGYDPFDLILHVAYDQPPLTRKERAERVRKRNYFAKYSPKARAVLDALLEKYADEGLAPVESPNALKVVPFPSLGTPVELIRAFGSKEEYEKALRELTTRLYETA